MFSTPTFVFITEFLNAYIYGTEPLEWELNKNTML